MSQKRILVVDDEDTILDMVSMILTDCGYSVVTTKHPGLAAIHAPEVDLIILDLKLSEKGDMDGDRILSKLWANTLFSVPIIIFSGNLCSNNMKDNLETITNVWGKGRNIYKCVEKGSGIMNLVDAVDSYFATAPVIEPDK
jgi:CheY-like chemotaxis protein